VYFTLFIGFDHRHLFHSKNICPLLFFTLEIFLFSTATFKYTYRVPLVQKCSIETTGTCFIQKRYAPSSSLLQGKRLPFSHSPLRLNIFRLFVIFLLTQLYHYTPEIFLFSTATFKYTYRAPLRRIVQVYSEIVV
jgi:hypothetical protein